MTMTSHRLVEPVSPTLARIFEALGKYQAAAGIYDVLADQEPDRATEYREHANRLRRRKKDT